MIQTTETEISIIKNGRVNRFYTESGKIYYRQIEKNEIIEEHEISIETLFSLINDVNREKVPFFNN